MACNRFRVKAEKKKVGRWEDEKVGKAAVIGY